MFQISAQCIDSQKCIEAVAHSTAGGVVIFEGRVRDHNQGHKVSSLEYQVYHSLAKKEGDKIIAEARARYAITEAICVHREGHLHIGDVAVFIATSAVHREAAFLASKYIIDQIKLRLPIWKREHYVSQGNQWVYCKDHATHVHFHEEDYYQRQKAILPPDQLRSKTVTVIGAGGLGCPALVSLATAGVGHIRVIDYDRIEISNIHRQPLYSTSYVGEKKVLQAQKKLADLNPFIQVSAIDQYVESSNIIDLIAGSDLVLDCTDNLKTKYLIHDACFKQKIPFIAAAIFKHEAQIRSFDPRAQKGCLRCQSEQQADDAVIGNCNEYGVLAASLSVVGGWQAVEALEFLCHNSNESLQRTILLNLKNFSILKIKNQIKPDCSCCRGERAIIAELSEITWQQAQARNITIVDIRNLPDSLVEIYKTQKTPVALACHRGVRSLKLVKQLQAAGYGHIYSLIGGYATVTTSQSGCTHHHQD